MPRRRIDLNGIVQGVGFRPYVYNLAHSLDLAGFVNNRASGVTIEIEGSDDSLDRFEQSLQNHPPLLARIVQYQSVTVHELNEKDFRIITTDRSETASVLIPPDIATCDNCLHELFDGRDRRYKYPFINCTDCGPRFTIIESIPYDRQYTSMRRFPMCPACQKEYDNPSDRRFHAQPNACPACGPKISLVDNENHLVTGDPLTIAINLLQEGNIMAIRGVGGFHLAVDPNNANAVNRLRSRKGRAEKPFALMARNLETVKQYCHLSDKETTLLKHYSRPIVLLRKKNSCQLPDTIAPANNQLGFMLPYTPLHHLLLADDLDILIMTSANYSEEPIVTGNTEAIQSLTELADYLLIHDREILQRCDDSIVKMSGAHTQYIRRSRGFVPYPVFINHSIESTILGVGGELKNCIGINRDNTVFLSQHIGDLDNPKAFTFFKECIEHTANLMQVEPTAIACDMHPEYLSTKWAKEQSLPVIEVQHHHAHLAAVMAEHNHSEKTLGLILDGTGYGPDNTIWGGELLAGDYNSFERLAWLTPKPMPGGTAAIKQPWRMALSYLYTANLHDTLPSNHPLHKAISSNQSGIIYEAIDKNINCPLTSSCGRMFDAVSALLGLCPEINYDAQAAILLEKTAVQSSSDLQTPVQLPEQLGPISTDEIVKTILIFQREKKPTQDIARWFHHSLVTICVRAVEIARENTGINTIALGGGVYMNELFTTLLLNRLTEAKFTVLLPKELPPNDGGLALGQILIANAALKQK